MNTQTDTIAKEFDKLVVKAFPLGLQPQQRLALERMFFGGVALTVRRFLEWGDQSDYDAIAGIDELISELDGYGTALSELVAAKRN